MDDKKARVEFLINKFREIIEKNHWHDNTDIYEENGYEGLLVYGQNGRFYQFSYRSDENWSINMFPRDIYGRKFWHGHGRGWEDVK